MRMRATRRMATTTDRTEKTTDAVPHWRADSGDPDALQHATATHTHTHTHSTPTAASNNVRQKRTYRAGQKSNLLILREYVNKTEEEYKQIRTAAENMKHCLTFSREIFCVTIVLCLNIR